MGHSLYLSLTLVCLLLVLFALPGRGPSQHSIGPLGLFESHGDVGEVRHRGSATFDLKTATYTVTGSGENMWGAKDGFHFVWKKATGDLLLSAQIAFVGAGKEPHRKACLMIRQSLDADSAYADVAVHGDGLTSLQFRDTKGGRTHEVQSDHSAPKLVGITKRGKYVKLYVSPNDRDVRFSGAATRIEFQEPFYIGIGVCSHNKDVTETAVFSGVDTAPLLEEPEEKPVLHSTLETQTIASTDRRVCYVTAGARIEAPNWLPDGKSLLFNSEGRIHRIGLAEGVPRMVDTGIANWCNNDHGISPDGKTLIISDQSQGDKQSRIYTLPVTGGTPKLVTPNAPSYWHGISPDGKTLAYCAQRKGEFDIYTIPIKGGSEKRLTKAHGLDDGPEYSHDGKYIYFNSERTGRMQIWRMLPDGKQQEQVTDDEYNNWFPHPSPDGKYLVFLSYEKDVTGHPENKDVTIRMMTLSTKKIDVMAKLFGGQGTINVPCWSPDSKKIAFVTYQMIP